MLYQPCVSRKGETNLITLFVNRLKLKALHRFTSTATAVEDITALQQGKIGKGLKQFLTDEVVGKGKGKESLVVIDPHLGSSSMTTTRLLN